MSATKTPAPLLAILRTGMDAATEEELLVALAGRIAEISAATHVDLLTADEGGLNLRASTIDRHVSGRMRIARGRGLSGEVYESGEPVFLETGAHVDPRFISYPGFDQNVAEAVAVLPMTDSGERIGVAFLSYDSPRIFDEEERRRLKSIAQIAALRFILFHNAYQSGTKVNRLDALIEVARTLNQSPYLEEILQLLVNITAEQFGYKVVSIRLLDPERGELVLRATQATARAYQRKPAIRLGESIAGRAIAENRAIIVPDVQASDEYIGHDLAAEQGLRSMICVPLVVQDRPVGVMSCYTDEPHEFLHDEVDALETLARQAAVRIEHAKLQVRHTLMQEMHHRVKNNLQQVASLLRLQLRQSHYKSLEEALSDSLARILAIAAVHDLLSREDLDHVGIRSIAEALVNYVQQSFLSPDKRLRFEVRGHDIHLNMTQATQVALVLNELIQNAVEHGFRSINEGDIHITIEDNDGEVGVWVSNNGERLPEGFDIAKSSHLGLQIVENLVRALGGKFSIEDRLTWTVCEVKFQRIGGE